jgi:hypothetical protein
VRMFPIIFSLISLYGLQNHSLHAGGPPHEIRATGRFDRPPGRIRRSGSVVLQCTLGEKRHIRQTNRVGLLALFPPVREEKAELCRVWPETCAFYRHSVRQS